MIKEITKLVAGSAASFGAGVVVDSALSKIRPDDLTNIRKVGFKIGSVVIVGIVGVAATQYAESVVDGFSKFINDIKELRKESIENE